MFCIERFANPCSSKISHGENYKVIWILIKEIPRMHRGKYETCLTKVVRTCRRSWRKQKWIAGDHYNDVRKMLIIMIGHNNVGTCALRIHSLFLWRRTIGLRPTSDRKTSHSTTCRRWEYFFYANVSLRASYAGHSKI